ncbi:hypothetical protein ACWDY4_26435 [Streptomyces olivaceoviridis]
MKCHANRAARSAIHGRSVAAASLSLCVALTLSACSSSDREDGTADKSPTVTKSPTPSAQIGSKATARAEAIAAYSAYWREMEKLYADPTGNSGDLEKYAASAALRNAKADAKSTHDRGLLNTGDVAITGQNVTQVDESGKIPHVTVSSCLDISRWRTVNAKTKKPVSLPKDRLTKYVIVSTVEKYPEGWHVTRDEPQGKSC